MLRCSLFYYRENIVTSYFVIISSTFFCLSHCCFYRRNCVVLTLPLKLVTAVFCLSANASHHYSPISWCICSDSRGLVIIVLLGINKFCSCILYLRTTCPQWGLCICIQIAIYLLCKIYLIMCWLNRHTFKSLNRNYCFKYLCALTFNVLLVMWLN